MFLCRSSYASDGVVNGVGSLQIEFEQDERSVETIQERRRLQKAARESKVAPSSFAGMLGGESWLKTQRKEELQCGRPPEMRPDVPVCLLCEIFAHFQEDVESIVLTREDCEFAGRLSSSMAGIFVSENERRDAFGDIFWSYMSSVDSSALAATFGGIGIRRQGMADVMTDGTVLASPSGEFVLNVEVKREKGEGKDSYMQNVKYYSVFWSNFCDGRRCQEDRCPSFLLELCGNTLSVSGAVWGKHACASPLTSLLYLLGFSLPQDEPALTHLARVCAALRKGVRALIDYYRTLPPLSASAHEVIKREARSCYPYVDHYFSKEQQKEIYFEYQKSLVDKKLLFLVKTEEGNRMVVKFCRRYNREAHRLCAQRGYAPRLASVEQLAGGWLMVVMEYIEGILLSECGCDGGWDASEVLGQVEDCVTMLHQNGYVHGDLRENNILVVSSEGSGTPSKAVLVDFDWAGRSGEDRYPLFMNHSEVTWPDGAEDGSVLEEAHDWFWFEKLRIDCGMNSTT